MASQPNFYNKEATDDDAGGVLSRLYDYRDQLPFSVLQYIKQYGSRPDSRLFAAIRLADDIRETFELRHGRLQESAVAFWIRNGHVEVNGGVDVGEDVGVEVGEDVGVDGKWGEKWVGIRADAVRQIFDCRLKTFGPGIDGIIQKQFFVPSSGPLCSSPEEQATNQSCVVSSKTST